MNALRWRRSGKKSGPCNVLNDRLEVVKSGSRWFVVDRDTQKRVGGPHKTMDAARTTAELVEGKR